MTALGNNIPAASNAPLAIRIKPGVEKLVRAGHPWIFNKAVLEAPGRGRPGDIAVVFDRKKRFLAVGLWDPTSQIRIRVLAAGMPEEINGQWFANRLSAAISRRKEMGFGDDTTGLRLVNGEGDGLPGLVLDRYGDTCVFKAYSAVWAPYLRDLADCAAGILGPKRIVLKTARNARKAFEKSGIADGSVMCGEKGEEAALFLERGIRLEADVFRGQKTGFFLDQRETRAMVESFASGKRVLDCFCYTGGFSISAARGGAAEVWSMDCSRPALEAAKRHFGLNAHIPQVAACRHEARRIDAFRDLSRLIDDGERFGVVVLDPPLLCASEADKGSAMRAQRGLARVGAGLVSEGGLLVQCSCSSHVSENEFQAAVLAGIRASGRPFSVQGMYGLPPDHPALIPEMRYLHNLVIRIG